MLYSGLGEDVLRDLVSACVAIYEISCEHGFTCMCCAGFPATALSEGLPASVQPSALPFDRKKEPTLPSPSQEPDFPNIPQFNKYCLMQGDLRFSQPP